MPGISIPGSPNFTGGAAGQRDTSTNMFGAPQNLGNSPVTINLGELLKPLSAPSNTGGYGIPTNSRLTSSAAISLSSGTFPMIAAAVLGIAVVWYMRKK